MISSLPSNFHTQRSCPVSLNLYPASVYMEFIWRKVHGDVSSQVNLGAPGPQSLLHSYLQGYCSGQFCAIQTLKAIRLERKRVLSHQLFQVGRASG